MNTAQGIEQELTRGMRRARELLSEVSDVRMDRIAEIKGAIQSGTYRIHSYEIARKMVDEALRESARRRSGKE